MQSLEILKQELITQKELLDGKGFPVNVKSVNPSPSEITEAIENINLDFSQSTSEESDVILGKTFYSKDTTLKTGTLVIPDVESATATEDTVLKGKTFYAGNTELKTGTAVIPDLSQTTATESDVASGKVFYNASGEVVTGTHTDSLQLICDNAKKLKYTFEGIKDTSLINNILQGLDTSKVESFEYTFSSSGISDISKLDFKNAKSFSYTFMNCTSLSEVSIDLSNATFCTYMFKSCPYLTKASLVSTSKVTGMQSMFEACSRLEELTGLDLLSCTSSSYLLYNCSKLKTLEVKNIKSTFQIGSGTSWGHLLTLDSLLNTIKELWTKTGTSTLKLTMGTANIEKLADVYVKLIDITDEMRAEDEYVDNKAPFVQCESTDEGAMLITEYVTTIKKWTLA